MAMTVTFYYPDNSPDAGALDVLASLDPDRDWRSFRRGEETWIVQTYLRLCAAGHPVALSATMPDEGIVVFHAKHKREVMRARPRLENVVLVGVRGDLNDPLIADFEIVQNGCFDDGVRRFHLPHWPQAGLRPRDRSRGSTVNRLAYKGYAGNLHPDFRDSRWRIFLDGLGVEWVDDSAAFRSGADIAPTDWNDYERIDVVLAVRPPDRRNHRTKPATKLVNCWRAGVPAVLGDEYAYREIRTGDLDYLVAHDLESAKNGVTALVENPALYAGMVENGRARAVEFTFDAVCARWAEFLYHRLPPLATAALTRSSRRLPLTFTRGLRRVVHLMTFQDTR